MRNREDKKCKKRQESIIGKIIYGFLLFMPLFAIGVTCGYAMFNKNAYKSYSGAKDEQFEIVDVTDFDNLKAGNRYRFISSNSETVNNSAKQLVIDNVEIISTNAINQSIINDISNAESISTTWYSNIAYLVPIIDNTSRPALDLNSYSIIFDFDLIGYTRLDNYTFSQLYDNFIKRVDYNDNYFADNVFYYSVDKVTESQLFNWAENSIIYTTTANTCNALSITTPFIPLLLAYWLIISVIYFLYDIALMLVWIIHRKIHEMQESI